MSRPIVLWGAKGQAKVIAEILPAAGFELIATFDNDPRVKSPFAGVPHYSGMRQFERWKKTSRRRRLYFLVAIGGGSGSERLKLHEHLCANGLTPAIAIHPSAVVSSTARIGVGSQVLARAVVGVETTLGIQCIVNTAASVDHECTLHDGAHVGPGATICGEVTIGKNAFVGAGAVVLPRVRVGEGAVVGAGSVVLRDVADGTIVVGNPAKRPTIKRRGSSR